MKNKKLYNFILLVMLLGLIALSNCTNTEGYAGDRDQVNQHANTPPGAPDSEYPGNSSDSTSNASHPDSVHHE